MTRSSRSDSSSSSGSSASLSSAAPQKAPVCQKQATRRGPQDSYVPPAGFEPVSFSSSPFAQPSLSEKELWAFRVPASIPASKLNGLVINLSSKDGRVGSIELPNSSDSTDTFNLYLSRPNTSNKANDEDLQQLIGMAASGAANPLNPNGAAKSAAANASVALEQGAAAELNGLRVLLPEGKGEKDGKMKLDSAQIKRHFHLSMASPAEADIGSTKKAVDQVQGTVRSELGSVSAEVREDMGVFENDKAVGAKAKRQQPWDRLKGSFKPAGSYTSNAQPEVAAPSEASPTKKEKKRKGTKSSPEKEKKKKSRDA